MAKIVDSRGRNKQRGTENDDVIRGLDGDDVGFGRRGHDRYYGGEGNDGQRRRGQRPALWRKRQ